MSRNKITIIENNGTFEIEKENLSDFALIGILECVLFDLKSVRRNREQVSAGTISLVETVEEAAETEKSAEKARETLPAPPQNTPEIAANTPDLRTRIGNAVKAVRNLGGKVEDIDLSGFSEEELQNELEELTAQYKRLKISKEKK